MAKRHKKAFLNLIDLQLKKQYHKVRESHFFLTHTILLYLLWLVEKDFMVERLVS